MNISFFTDKKTIRLYAIIISLLLHIIFFYLWEKSSNNLLPLEFSQQDVIENRLEFELVDTNEQESEKPEMADLVSDHNNKAADNIDSEIISDLPQNSGDVQQKSLEEVSEIAEQPKQDSKPRQPHKSFERAWQEKLFSLAKDYNYQPEPLPKQTSPDYQQMKTTVENQGGMMFNTYEWEFAPYMLAMKRKVQSNIHPPMAFTQLGAVSGDVLVRFRVYPNGKVTAMEILDSNAHYSLDQTSTRAISISNPFLPLPSNFPEPYLEVTALFSYTIIK